MVGKAVYVEDNVIQKEASDSPLAWIGFSIVDTNKGGIGTIEDVIKMGPQWLAKLTINEQEVLIPLVDDWIKDLNIKNKFIRMALPEGLIEIYTQN
ncbi:MAG: rRNA processing protein RimM [Bacteroidota bacterium]